MSFTLTNPGALWLLLAVPVVWVGVWLGRTNFNRRQRLVQAAVRSVVLALLAIALVRPTLSTSLSQQAIVYVVDLSHSVSSGAIASAADRIDELNEAVQPDASVVVGFGASTTVLPDTAALRALAVTEPEPDADPVGRGGTDIEAALMDARAATPLGTDAPVVLFSDGRETTGDARAAALQLAATGIPVFVEPLAVRDLGDMWIDDMVVPDSRTAGQAMTLTALIGSQRDDVEAVVQVREGTAVLARQPARIRAGMTSVPIVLTLDSPGSHLLEAVLSVPGDALEANNRLTQEVVVPPVTRVLYVEGVVSSATYLQRALTQVGFEVAVRPPSGVPTSAEDLSSWDVVILSDLAPRQIPEAAMSALAVWVEQSGGGLLVAGGDAVFGETTDGAGDGYRRTELERLLPVTFERQEDPDVALVMVLDKSWSMNGRVIELCKAAAEAAVEALSDRQTVGVLSFDDRMHWDVEPQNVGQNREAIHDAIASIEPGGDTLIYPAVAEAHAVLSRIEASTKHVVLLSDGRSYPDDYEGLVTSMANAGITVSSIAVGPSADAVLLSDIARWGKGRAYAVLDAEEVTQIFVKEARTAMSAFDEGQAVMPVVRSASLLHTVDLADMPPLYGRTAAVLKDSAIEVLTTEREDPILAFWPVGLGRTAVFTSDVKDRWARDWLAWRGYGPLFAAVAGAIARPTPEPMSIEIETQTARGGDRWIGVSIEARDERGRYRDLMQPVVHVESATGATLDVPARQVLPGRYEATAIVPADEPLVVMARLGDGSAEVVRHVLPDLDAEYRLRPTNDRLLDALAAATGGRAAPTPSDLRARADSIRTARRALWPALVVVAMLLWMADVALRRIRLFERHTA